MEPSYKSMENPTAAASAHETREETKATGSSRSLRHQLRTELNQIIGYSELLIDEAEERGQTELLTDLKRVYAAGRRLLRLFNEQFDPLTSRSDNASEPVVGVEIPAGIEAALGLPARGRALLWAQDDASSDLLTLLLQRQGIAVVCVTDADEAWQAFSAQSFDVVFLYASLLEATEFSLLQRLKASEKHSKLPVILIAPFDETDSLAQGLTLGADDYLLEPFHPALVQARLHLWLKTQP